MFMRGLLESELSHVYGAGGKSKNYCGGGKSGSKGGKSKEVEAFQEVEEERQQGGGHCY